MNKTFWTFFTTNKSSEFNEYRFDQSLMINKAKATTGQTKPEKEDKKGRNEGKRRKWKRRQGQKIKLHCWGQNNGQNKPKMIHTKT